MAEGTMQHPDQLPESRWEFLKGELRPKGKIFTPFNIISIPVILLGLVLIAYRFVYGIGAVSNVDQLTPWGLWKGFNVVTGVAFAGGAYILTFMVYVLGMKQFKPVVRITVLNGFLAYLFYAGALILDLGRPWKIVNPLIGNDFGTSSVLFLIAWHFVLYMIAELVEFSPAIAEWLRAPRARRFLAGLGLGAVVLGITLSTLHQSGLGALYLMSKGKIHPLWYSEFIPIHFFVSSVFAGLSVVIMEGMITNRVFAYQLSESHHREDRVIMRGLARVSAGAMFAYLFLKVVDVIHGHNAHLLGTGWGLWYLIENLGFVALPMIMFIQGLRTDNAWLLKAGSIITVFGIVLNRLNISIITWRYYAPDHYIPSWMEIVVSLTIIFIQIWIFRWVVHRMPVLRKSPYFGELEH